MIKIVLPLVAAAGLLGGTAPLKQNSVPQMPGARDVPLSNACDHTIQLVREASGMGKIERGTASPDAPLFIAAVDHRIGNCRVLVMANDNRDIRPEPTLPEGPVRMMPAR